MMDNNDEAEVEVRAMRMRMVRDDNHDNNGDDNKDNDKENNDVADYKNKCSMY